MAQMMCFMSFGPVLFVVASHRYLCSFKISLLPVRWLVYVKNMDNNNEKLTMAQTMWNMSFGPVFVSMQKKQREKNKNTYYWPVLLATAFLL